MKALVVSHDSDDATVKQTREVVELDVKLGVNATFFQRVSEKRGDDVTPTAFNLIKDAGFEVAAHPYLYDECTRKSFIDEVRKVEELADCKVFGVRNHGLVWKDEMPSWEEEVGVEYDSNEFEQRVGFSRGSTLPFFLEGSSVLELPLALMDSEIRSPLNAVGFLESAARFNQPATICFHTRRLCADAGNKRLFVELVSIAKARGFWVCSFKQFNDYWRNRGEKNEDLFG